MPPDSGEPKFPPYARDLSVSMVPPGDVVRGPDSTSLNSKPVEHP